MRNLCKCDHPKEAHKIVGFLFWQKFKCTSQWHLGPKIQKLLHKRYGNFVPSVDGHQCNCVEYNPEDNLEYLEYKYEQFKLVL